MLNNHEESIGVKSTENRQFIVFILKGQKFGINVLKSREIITTESLTVIPESPNFIKGVIELREEIIPIIDLNKKFNLKNNIDKVEDKIVIINVNNTLIGLAVNEVEEIIRINKDNISKAPEITKGVKKDYIYGIARLENELIILIDIDNVFSHSDIKKLQDLDDNNYFSYD